MKDFEELGEHKVVKKEHKVTVEREDNWPAFIKLCMTVFGRSIITNGMSTFLSLYFIQVLLQSESVGNSALSIYFAIGAIATLVGGSLADHFGYTRMISISFAIFVPRMIIFTMTHHMIFAVIMLIPLAIAESLSYSPMVVLGQQYLPNHTGFASGITLGLAVSVGAILCPVLGVIADSYGLIMTLYVIAGIGFIVLLSSLLTKVELK